MADHQSHGKEMSGDKAHMNGTHCKPDSSGVVPMVDPAKCEAKGECVKVCPYDVFEVTPRTPDEIAGLGFLSRIKARAHGNMIARTPGIDRCHSCSDCVTACPERAIQLVPRN
ncbi:MAG: 4Fe-4S dicluster domain-containing protein [Candidatus Thermoplasmatota archaeon]|nr:4Fe-4S dicluster domain-containing protein [Candidatus Thermoplasmatota archaeon]